MSPPSPESNIRPVEMHAEIEARYKPMPEKPDGTLATLKIGGIILLYLFIAIPIIESVFDHNGLIHLIAFIGAGSFAYSTFTKYKEADALYSKELALREAVKKKYEELQQWFDNDRHTHRVGVGYRMFKGKPSKYPMDWKVRREYIRIRDGGCFLCNDTRNLSGEGDLRHEAHHILPISQKGSHDIENLVYLCLVCHEDQHEHMLKSRLAALRKTSRRHSKYHPKWDWIEDIEKRLKSLESHRMKSSSKLLHKYRA